MNLQVAKRLQQTDEYYFSRKLREIDEMNKAGAKVISLGIGSPDLSPHPSVIAALNEYAQRPNTHAYQSYKGIPALRQAMAAWYKRYYHVELDAEKEILPLIGSKEGIMHICMTYLQEGDEALVPNPGYPAYRSAVNLTGATVVDYDLEEKNGWLPDLDALAKKNLSKVKLMWVNYPHMPTGARFNVAFAEQLVQFGLQHNILICHDNPYSFILNKEPQSLLQTQGAKEAVLELNSLSKSFNMAGWRVGMMVGKQEWINEVLRFKSNMDSGMFLPLQMAAVKALKLGPEWYTELNKIYEGRRKKVFQLLQLLNCTFDTEQVGLFVWAKIPATAKDSFALTDEILQKAQVFITPGCIFGSNGNSYIRISLCKDEKTLDEVLVRIQSKFKS